MPFCPENGFVYLLLCKTNNDNYDCCFLCSLGDLYLSLGSYYSSFGEHGWEAQGLVAIYNKEFNRYEFICDEGWDLNDAHVICRMMGFPGASDASVRSQYGLPYLETAAMSNVQCTGTENSIFDCPSDPNPSCNGLRSAGVHCLGNYVHLL